MFKYRNIILMALGMLLLTGCDSLKAFMSKDLEDEDFIIGQLYVDEMVTETPVIARPVEKPSSARVSNPLGLSYSEKDNMELYEAINSWLGVPYKYGGTDRNGIDCSAFVGVIYKQVYGITLNRTANDMTRDVTFISKTQLREGDLVFFTNSKGKVSHVGIYLKDGLFAHSSTSNGVSVSRLDNTYWQKHFYKGGRVKK
ncbi:MAG: C40 family peptidase [Bacteroidales bacterium]|nr:C40 family peptidase [Bacteroidales bacterium]